MPARKRTGSSSLAAEAPAPRRRSGRISSTPKKSAYFEADSDDAGVKMNGTGRGKGNLNGNNEARGVEKGRGRPSLLAKTVKTEDEDREEGSDDGDDESVKDGDFEVEDEEDEEEYDEDEDDEDAPPKVTVIPLATLRPEDGVEYEDEKLHKNTLLFLKDLKKHNQRSWLKGESPINICLSFSPRLKFHAGRCRLIIFCYWTSSLLKKCVLGQQVSMYETDILVFLLSP